MGQRLNIEITDGNKCLANCYYHWSAYTKEAAILTYNIIQYWKVLHNDISDPLQLAVRLLELTGGGVNIEERVMIQADHSFNNMTFQPSTNRNRGLISVTENGINGTRACEEGRVTIDIAHHIVTFGVWCYMPHKEFADEYGSIGDEYSPAYATWQVLPFMFDRIDDFYTFTKDKDSLYDQNGVYMFIE